MNSFILEKKLPTLWKEPPLGGRGLAFHRPCQQRKRKGEMLENVGPVRAALSTTFSSGPFSASATDDTARVGLGGGRTSIRRCGFFSRRSPEPLLASRGAQAGIDKSDYRRDIRGIPAQRTQGRRRSIMLKKHPLAAISVAYKRAVVRACAEWLREIEGRLAQPCGARWDQQLAGCDDLATVARLVLSLQRRSSLKTAESGWLEDLATLKPEEADKRAVPITLAVKRRLTELSEAVPYSVPPSSLLGARVLRQQGSAGAHQGVVLEFEPLVGFRVRCSRDLAEALAEIRGSVARPACLSSPALLP